MGEVEGARSGAASWAGTTESWKASGKSPRSAARADVAGAVRDGGGVVATCCAETVCHCGPRSARLASKNQVRPKLAADRFIESNPRRVPWERGPLQTHDR